MSYADNVFDNYQPLRLSVEAIKLKPLTDPFGIGLEGIRLGKARSNVV
jgi:hypothetical protein